MNHISQITELYNFLSAPNLPERTQPAIVFGRKDPLVAYALGDLVMPGLVTTAVITGGIGKDSGDIVRQGYHSEAEWLHDQLSQDAAQRGYQLPTTLLETRATHGGENARFSLALLLEHDVVADSLTAVAHATSARRLAETLRFEASILTDKNKPTVHTQPTSYAFDPKNPTDRDEAMAEFARLIEWPAKGWLHPQPDLPQNLVDFVMDQGYKAPPQPSSLAGSFLRLLPRRARAGLLAKLK